MKRVALALALASTGTAAAAQAAADATLEIASDHRRRGLSWSGGRAAATAAAGVAIGPTLRADVAATTLRGARRHGGADAGFDLSLAARTGGERLRLDGGVSAHIFAGGRGALDYVELNGAAGTLIGPAQMTLSADYAPRQDAIGGDNLYLRLGVRAAVIGTPLTLTAHVGRSSGDGDGRPAARRLRPDGRYHDWSLGADYVRGPVTLRLAYQDSDIGRVNGRRPGGGATLVASAVVGF